MTYRHASADGLAHSNDPELISTWDRIGQEHRTSERNWVTELRARGVKAAHPDDGWVDRTRSTFQMVYPQFNDSPQVNDQVALGWPWEHRIVTVTDVEHRHGVLLNTTHYHFTQ